MNRQCCSYEVGVFLVAGALRTCPTAQQDGRDSQLWMCFSQKGCGFTPLIFKWPPQSMPRKTSTGYKARQKQVCLMRVTGGSLCRRRIQNGLRSKPGLFTCILSGGLTKQCERLVAGPADSSATFELTSVSDLRESVSFGVSYCAVQWCLVRDSL